MNNKELVLFTSTNGNVTIDVQLKNDTVWLSLNHLSGRDK